MSELERLRKIEAAARGLDLPTLRDGLSWLHSETSDYQDDEYEALDRLEAALVAIPESEGEG